MLKDKSKIKLLAQNKKAFHNYFIEETFQAGLSLVGTEVKSLRAGKCNLTDGYISIESREAYANNMHISPYDHGNVFNRDPLRKRKLLLHKWQINKLIGAVTRDGYTIVPLRVYFAGSYVKMDIALAKGKKLYDKRDSIAKKDQMREMEREFRGKDY